MQPQRLSIATLSAQRSTDVAVPRVDPSALGIGIVHFGIGAFHRAHQAVFTEDAAAATGETGWGILGVTGRTDAVVRQLRPQDCLYGVLQKGAAGTALRLIGSIREVASPGSDSDRVADVIAAGTTHLATLTITEKGYLRGADGAIDLALPALRHDLALIERELTADTAASVAGASQTPIGLLVRGLARRFRRGGAPFSVVACDNLVGNGAVARAVVTSLVAAIGADAGPARDAMLAWLAASVAFPSTMVDRITPATTEGDRADALALLGLRDEALVVAEPFTQWVIEDSFAGPRPAWELAGAIMTDDVAPYERAKLRVLNATHSLLAYLGALKGYRTIAEAVGDPALLAVARRVIDDDTLPTLEAPAGLDLGEYRDSVLSRFANPTIEYTTMQVAMDGSQKLPNRVLSSAIARFDAGHTPLGLALVIAAWITFIAWTTADAGPALADPLAEELRAAVGSPGAIADDPAGVVDRVLRIGGDTGGLFPAELRTSTAYRDAIVSQLAVVRDLVGD